MNRLQKKCFIASAGCHSLLVLILLVGPAFLTSNAKIEDVPVLDFYPIITTDAPFAGGGNRNAVGSQTPKIIPPAPAPQPQKESPPPEPRKQPESAPKLDPDAFDTAKETRHKPKINTNLIARKKDVRNTPKANVTDNESQARDQQLADKRNQLLKQLANATEGLRQGKPSGTSIEQYGPGTGGPSYANYMSYVKTIYENAWLAPDDTANDDAVAKVSVTIARDGTVLSSRITRPSGDSQVDRSVQRALDRVTFVAPFPEGSKDKQRTFIINFNLKAKRGLA